MKHGAASMVAKARSAIVERARLVMRLCAPYEFSTQSPRKML